MAVMTTFPLSFVVILSRGHFSINADILDFSQNCSYTVLTLSFRRASGMPRTESSSAMSQGYLDFYYMSSAISLLGSGLGSQCKNGPGPQILGPHKYYCLLKKKKKKNSSLIIFFVFHSSIFHTLLKNSFLEESNRLKLTLNVVNFTSTFIFDIRILTKPTR